MEEAKSDLGIYLHQKELADLTGISAQAVSKLIRDNEITTVKKGQRLQVIPPNSMDRIIKLKKLKKYKGTVAFHIIKGGVGKSTLAHSLGSRAAALGHRVLLVDLDQQANLSHSFGIWPKLGTDPTLLNVYTGELKGKPVRAEDAIVPINDYLHLLPSNLSLANLDSQLLASGTENIGHLFEEIFGPLKKKYDVIFFDCPPALSKVTSAVHCFVDLLVLPVNADTFSMEGLQLTIDNMKLLKKKKYPVKAKISIVLNRLHAHHKMSLEVMKTLSEHYGKYLVETFVSSTKKIENSLATGRCVWEDKNKNNALEDMHNLLIELLGLDSWKDTKHAKKRGVH